MAKGNKIAIAFILAKKAASPDEGPEEVNGCPIATQDIKVNLEKRAKAVEIANYGPLNPASANTDFWKAKADLFKTTPAEAKKSLCANCAAFIQTTKMLDCIEKGLDVGLEGSAVVDKANLGYCEIFDFKCAGDRTCDAWVFGGAIVDKDIEEETTEEMD